MAQVLNDPGLNIQALDVDTLGDDDFEGTMDVDDRREVLKMLRGRENA